MGVAATRRGDAVLRAPFEEAAAEARRRDNLIRAMAAEEEAHVWRRECNTAVAEAIARGGILGGTLAKVDRVSQARMGAAVIAQERWQLARSPIARAHAAQVWAAAVYRWADWSRGMCRLAVLDDVPRPVRHLATKLGP